MSATEETKSTMTDTAAASNEVKANETAPPADESKVPTTDKKAAEAGPVDKPKDEATAEATEEATTEATTEKKDGPADEVAAADGKNSDPVVAAVEDKQEDAPVAEKDAETKATEAPVKPVKENKVGEENGKACCAGKRTCDAVSKENEGSPKSRAKVEQDKPAETEHAGNGKADMPAEEKVLSDATKPATAPVGAQ